MILTQNSRRLAWLDTILLLVVLDLQFLGPSDQQLYVRDGHILLINAEDVVVEFVQELGLLLPLLLLGLDLLKILGELVFLIGLSEPFLDQGLVYS